MRSSFSQHGADLAEQIIHLRDRRAHLDFRVHQPGGPHHLFHDLPGMRLLIGSRRGRHEHRLGQQLLPFLKLKRTVVQRRGQPEAVLYQRLLARAVAAEHGADLRNTGMGFIHNHQRVVRQVLEQGRRRLPGARPGQVARVVLHALAVTQLADHLDIVARALLQPLRLQQLVVVINCLTRSSSSTSMCSMAFSMMSRDVT